MALLLRALRKRAEASEGRERPVDWSEWKCFLSGACACGFVVRDGEEREGYPLYERLKHTPETAKEMSLYDLKCLIHYVVRSERWGDAGGDFGGNTLWQFITSRGGQKVVERFAVVAGG
jgi:hypothetical protein